MTYETAHRDPEPPTDPLPTSYVRAWRPRVPIWHRHTYRWFGTKRFMGYKCIYCGQTIEDHPFDRLDYDRFERCDGRKNGNQQD